MDEKYLMRVGEAAKLVRIPRTTILAAMDRQEITPHRLACGLPVVRLADIQRWAEHRPRRGRAPQRSKP